MIVSCLTYQGFVSEGKMGSDSFSILIRKQKDFFPGTWDNFLFKLLIEGVDYSLPSGKDQCRASSGIKDLTQHYRKQRHTFKILQKTIKFAGPYFKNYKYHHIIIS